MIAEGASTREQDQLTFFFITPCRLSAYKTSGMQVADFFVDMAMVEALAKHVAWHVLGGEHLIDDTKQERIEALAEVCCMHVNSCG